MAQSPAPIDQLWTALAHVRRLRFSAQSSMESGWNGAGEGVAAVTALNDGCMIYSESGCWTTARGETMNFTNVFRWTLLPDLQRIRLEHLRHGEDKPVHLFDVETIAAGDFRSVQPHVCREDLYSAVLRIDNGQLLLRWRVTGPRKDNAIEYVYW